MQKGRRKGREGRRQTLSILIGYLIDLKFKTKKRVTVSLCFSTQKGERGSPHLFPIYKFFYHLEVTQVTQRGI